MNIVSINDRKDVARTPSRRAGFDTEVEITESRALVAVSPPAPVERESHAAYRPAEFLAQLIAIRDQSPQMRERRREEPAVAVSAYGYQMAAKPSRKHIFERAL